MEKSWRGIFDFSSNTSLDESWCSLDKHICKILAIDHIRDGDEIKKKFATKHRNMEKVIGSPTDELHAWKKKKY